MLAFNCKCDISFFYPQLNQKRHFYIQFFLPVFVLDKMSLLRLRVGDTEQFTLFRTLSKADEFPRFFSYSPLVRISNITIEYSSSPHFLGQRPRIKLKITYTIIQCPLKWVNWDSQRIWPVRIGDPIVSLVCAIIKFNDCFTCSPVQFLSNKECAVMQGCILD